MEFNEFPEIQNLFSLTGRVALVTGGSRGIGRAVCLCLAAAGARVAVNYHHRKTEAEEVVSACEGVYPGDDSPPLPVAVAVQADVSDSYQVERLCSEVARIFGTIHITVNNAGLITHQKVIELSDEDWHSVLQANLDSVFYTSRAALRWMIPQKWGRIVNISSHVAQRGSINHAHYAAAKAGVVAFTKSLAREVASDNILANAIAPGRMDTQFNGISDPNELKRQIAEIPLGRIGSPADVAKAVLFLVSDLGSYLTGQVITINGGALMP